jgi:hypothetical protein
MKGKHEKVVMLLKNRSEESNASIQQGSEATLHSIGFSLRAAP